MSAFKSTVAAIAATLLCTGAASAIEITVDTFDLQLGAGYAMEDSDDTITLSYSADGAEPLPFTFSIPNGGDLDQEFLVGSFTYNEGDTSAEVGMDPSMLGATATFTLGNGQELTLTGQGDVTYAETGEFEEFVLTFDPEEFLIDGETVLVTLSDFSVFNTTQEPFTDAIGAVFSIVETPGQEVPAPGAIGLLGLGLLGLGMARRRR